MKITLEKRAPWSIHVEGHEPIDVADLTPLNLSMLGALIAQNVHEGQRELQVSINLRGAADLDAVESLRDYIERVHANAVSRARLKEVSHE